MAYMTYYRSLLTDKEKKAYDLLVEGISKREDDILLPRINEDELQRVHLAVDYDYPDFFYVNFYQYRYSINFTHTEVSINYVMDKQTAKRLKREIDIKANKIVAGAKGMTELETEAYLNDEIRKLAVYDTNGDNFNVQHIVGVFIDGKCVCEGFAKAFKYLADMLKLKCILVIGDSGVRGATERHGWNMVKIGNDSYHIDVTYNDIKRDEKTGNIIHFSRAYFNLSDKEICRDHTIDTMFKVPSCPKSRSEVPIISSTPDLVDFLRKEAYKNKTISEARLTKYFQADELMKMIEKSISLSDYRWFKKLEYISIEYYSLIVKWE